MTFAISPFISVFRRGMSRLGGTMAAFLFSLALAGCGGSGGGSGFLGDSGGNVGDGAGPGTSVVSGAEGISEERRRAMAARVAGLDLGGEDKVRTEDVQVSEDPEILNQNPFATAETAPETVAEARGFERQSVEEERKTPGYKAFEVAVPADNPLMTVAVWISETAPEEEVELPEGKPERDPEAPRKFLYVRLQVYVSTRNFAAVEGGGVEVLETKVIAVEERLPDPKPPAGADECEAAGWKAARVDGNAINCLIPLTSGGTDFEGCVLAGEFEPLCSEVFGEDFAFPTKVEGEEARYVFDCGAGMIPEGVNAIGATQCFSAAAVNCTAGSLPANGMTQADLNVALRLAARRGDAGQVCEMLRRGAEVNDDLNGTEFTALQEAVSEGHLAAAELLLANGAEVNARKEGAGPSALDLAARAKNAEIAAVLRAAEGRCFLESGGLCEETVVAGVCAAGTLSANGLTQGELDAGMISAAEGGDADEVCEYLRRGADVEAQKSGNLRTALMVAAEEGHADVVELLLDNGAEVNRRGGNGGYGGRPNPGRWRDYPDSNWPALLYASSRGHADVVRIMLENGADVELGDDRKRRPLWEAAFYGHQDVMDLLLDNGADVDVADAWGITPLHAPGPHYGYPGDLEWNHAANVAEYLISRGANVNARDTWGRSPLDLYAGWNHPNAAAVVREAGGRCFVETGELCEVAVASDTVCTAGTLAADGLTQAQLDAGLISAVRADNLEDACEYLRRGANVGARETSVPSTEHHRKTGLIIAAFHEQAEMAKLLLNNGADVNQVISGRSTQTGGYRGGIRALSYAFSDPEIVKLLLDRGADVNAQEENGRTALWEAAHWGFWKSVKVLLDGGANPNLLDYLGASALYGGVVGKRNVRAGPSGYVRFTGWRGYDFSSLQSWPKVVSLLLAAGADVNAREGTENSGVLGYRGYSSLDFAARMRYSDIAEILRDAGGRCFVRTGPLCEVAVATPEPVVGTVVASDTVCTAGSLSANGMTQAQLDAGLMAATKEGDLATACEYLRRGADPNGRDAHQHVPLMHAKADLDMGGLLLANGAKMSVWLDGGWWTPLFPLYGIYTAAQIEFYLSRGADVNLGWFNSTWTPLHEAAFYGKWLSMQLLLDGGVDPNVRAVRPGWRGRTALHEAVGDSSDSFHFAIDASNPPFGMIVGNSARAVSVLLEGGAEVNARDGRGYSPLDRAALHSKTAAAAVLRAAGGRCFVRTGPLCEEAPAPVAVVSTVVASDTVCAAGSLSANGMTQAQLDAGLIAAVRGDNLENACEYLRRGANPGARETSAPSTEHYRKTGLMIAAVYGQLEMAKLLLNNGAEANQKAPVSNSRGWIMALPSAIRYPEIIKLLLDRGADINLTEKDGRGALWGAAHWGFWESVKLLLERGADPNLVDTWGASALYGGVVGIRNIRDMRYVQHTGWRGDDLTPLQSWPKVVSLLLAAGADVNAREETGNSGYLGYPGYSSLDFAARRGYSEVAGILRNAGGRCFVRTGPLCGEAVATPEPVVSTVVASDTVCTAGSLSGNGMTQAELHAGLVSAVKAGDMAGACEHLRRGADVNGGDANGYSALMHAGANLEMGGLLLANGAEVHTQWPNGRGWWTPLYMHGHPDAIEFYLSHGADPDVGWHNSTWTPLHEAAYYNKWRAMEILLGGGADPDIQTTRSGWRGGAPLHYIFDGSRANSGRAVSVLVSGGAEVNARDSRGRSGLDLAARQGDADAAAVLRGAGGVCFVETGPLCEVEVAAPDPVVATVVTSDTVCTAGSLSADGMTQRRLNAGLISAARGNDLAGVCEYLRRGANVDAQESEWRYYKRTPLMIAAMDGNLELGKLLRRNGADVNLQVGNYNNSVDAHHYQGNRRMPALHYAAGAGRKEFVEWLLSEGANVRALQALPRDALWEAAFWGRPEIVRILLAAGADANKLATGENLALWDAVHHPTHWAKYGNPRWGVSDAYARPTDEEWVTVISILVANGADVNVREPQGASPLDIAVRRGNAYYAELMREYGSRCFVETGPLCEVAVATPVTSDTVCAAGSLSANGMTERQLTDGLVLATEGNDLPKICEYLRRGANVEAIESGSCYKRTPLMIAANDGNLDAAKLLHTNGANVNRQSGNHVCGDPLAWSALMYAAAAGHLEMARWLLDSGAEIEAEWSAGVTALWEAAYWGRPEVLRLLLSRGASWAQQDGWGNTALRRLLHDGAVSQWTKSSWQYKRDALSYSYTDPSVDANVLVISLLAEAGADVNNVLNGRSVLDDAVSRDFSRYAEMLRSFGAECRMETGPLCGEVAVAVVSTVVASDTVCAAGSLSADGMAQAQLDAGLIAAAGEGDLTTACEYLRRGANPNGRDAHQHVPLMHAKAHLDMGELLLANGADKYVLIDGNGWWSPLFPLGGIYTAAQIEFYLSRGVDPNFGSLGGGDYDWRPLHEAAFYGKWNAIKHLLDGGAVPNVHTSRPGWRGRTPLHEAVGDSSDSFHFAIDASNPPFGMIVGNSARAVSVLLEGGAEVNALDGRGYSPLDRAAVYSKTAAAAVLRAAGGRCFVRTGPLCGEARVAVEYSSSANGTVSADVANGGEVARGATVAFTATPAEGFYVSGWTGGCVDAVAGSVGDGGAKVCSLIAEAALSVGAVFAEVPSLAGPECPGGTMPGNGLTQAELNTQLRLAARNGDTRKICEMLRRGAEVNDNLDGNEFTALQEAVSEGHKAAAEMLLANDAHVNARKGGTGPAPLDLAAQNENAEIAQILRDADGQCFVEIGPLCGEYLPAATLDPSTVAVTATTTATVAIKDLTCPTEPLSAEGATQSALDKDLLRAMRRVVDQRGYERACNLVRRGADVNYVSDYGKTPLHHVFGDRRMDTPPGWMDVKIAVAKLLIGRGGDVNATDNDEQTPLYLAVKHQCDNYPDFCVRGAEFLIDKGADVDAQEENGWTTLSEAAWMSGGQKPPAVEGMTESLNKVAQALIRAGADPNIKDFEGATSLHDAFGGGGLSRP